MGTSAKAAMRLPGLFVDEIRLARFRLTLIKREPEDEEAYSVAVTLRRHGRCQSPAVFNFEDLLDLAKGLHAAHQDICSLIADARDGNQ